MLYARVLRLSRMLSRSSGCMKETNAAARAAAERNDTKALGSRLSALRASLPRRLWPRSELAHVLKEGNNFSIDTTNAGTMVVQRGERRAGSSRTAKVTGIHADDLARHNKLLERMRFGGPTWKR